MDNEIEMNDLLGHAEDVVLSTTEKGARHDGIIKKAGPAKPGSNKQWLISRMRMNRYRILVVIIIVLIGTVIFMVDRIYMSREGIMDTLLETDENTQKAKEEDKIEGQDHHKIDNNNKNNAIGDDKPSKQAGDCIDDPDFRFKNKPKKNCDWVGQNQERVCDKSYKGNKLVRDVCPVACGDCFIIKEDQENQINNVTVSGDDDGCDRNPENCNDNSIIKDDVVEEDQESKAINDEKKGDEHQTSTIGDNDVDDRDVYCEDLSQYQKWHETKITKKDGAMYRVLKQMNHDQTSFTQGLTYARGKLFESAGLYGKSTVRILNRDSASVEKKVPMETSLFAEGLAYYKDTLVQITWKSRRGFIYNITDLEEIDNFTFSTTLDEGWGITWDRCNDELIVTDGSENLHFWDPTTMKEKRRVSVKRMDGSKALEMNEIEFWRGRVLANIWFEDVILVINPETGVVEKEYDFSRLWPKSERRTKRADVLNGISISEDPNILYFTGKLWNRMYGIQLLPDL